jgi:hypothetical protein
MSIELKVPEIGESEVEIGAPRDEQPEGLQQDSPGQSEATPWVCRPIKFQCPERAQQTGIRHQFLAT